MEVKGSLCQESGEGISELNFLVDHRILCSQRGVMPT